MSYHVKIAEAEMIIQEHQCLTTIFLSFKTPWTFLQMPIAWSIRHCKPSIFSGFQSYCLLPAPFLWCEYNNTTSFRFCVSSLLVWFITSIKSCIRSLYEDFYNSICTSNETHWLYSPCKATCTWAHHQATAPCKTELAFGFDEVAIRILLFVHLRYWGLKTTWNAIPSFLKPDTTWWPDYSSAFCSIASRLHSNCTKRFHLHMRVHFNCSPHIVRVSSSNSLKNSDSRLCGPSLVCSSSCNLLHLRCKDNSFSLFHAPYQLHKATLNSFLQQWNGASARGQALHWYWNFNISLVMAN